MSGGARGAGGAAERGGPGGAEPPPLVSVVGWKNSGKTGLVVELVRALTDRGRRVMTLKHGHGFDLDTPGTDSWRHREEGGAHRVVMAGPEEVAVVGRWGPGGEQGPRSLAARFLADAELVVAEGWKEERLPTIEVHRSGVGPGLLYDPEAPESGLWVAVVTDREDLSLPLPVLPLGAAETARRLADMLEATLLAPAEGAGADAAGDEV